MNKFLFISSLFLSTFSFTQEKIKLEEIMQGYVFIGHPPRNHFWSWDNQRIYFEWNPNNELDYSYYYWEEGSKYPKKLPLNEYNNLYLTDENQRFRTKIHYLKEGILFCFDTKTKTHQKLFQLQESISKLICLKEETKYVLQIGDNLFLYDSKSGSLIQLSNFKKGHASNSNSVEKTFLEAQQTELFQYIRKKEDKEKFAREIDQVINEKFPKATYIGNKEIENLQLSNNGKYVLVRLSEYPQNLETNVEHEVTKSGYSKTQKAREKVSINAISKHQLAILDLEKDSLYYVDFSKLSGFSTEPAYLSLYSKNENYTGTKKEIVMHEAIFDLKSINTLIDIRSQDNKDRWIVNLDLKSGKIDELEHQHDPAWIGGPGISEWNFEKGVLGFMKDENFVYFQSEESGYSHLYQLDLQTKNKKALTNGNWEVKTVFYVQENNQFYLSANKTHPGNLDCYLLNPSSNTLSPIFTKNGAHEVKFSSDYKKIAVLYSDKTHPWELFIAKNQANSTLTQITSSTSKAFKLQNWITPDVISFKAKDQTEIYARIYPAKKQNNKAAIIFVHGAGYLQNAHNYWSSYYREFMFHQLLVEEGYTVLDIDYRASEGYGRDFRTGIYRHMGGLDLSDHLDGRKLLIEKYGIDSTKIGIYGGSYGGFISLMALLTEPGKFKCGAALRAVTDWAHYNQEYTSNILNFPETDPEAYRKSSPIYFAENLKDPLLLLHGMVDDNVQFQDIVRLSERFIELGKKEWDVAIYPIEAHGFKESYSWLDEYRRIYEFMVKNLGK